MNIWLEFDFNKFTNDIDKSIEIFNDLFNYNPIFFSYPFGEYSLEQKNLFHPNLNLHLDNIQVLLI